MGCDRVVSLGERFLRNLPIAAKYLGHMGGLVPLLVRKQCEMIGQVTEEILERFCVEIWVDKDEPAPTTNLDFGQT